MEKKTKKLQGDKQLTTPQDSTKNAGPKNEDNPPRRGGTRGKSNHQLRQAPAQNKQKPAPRDRQQRGRPQGRGKPSQPKTRRDYSIAKLDAAIGLLAGGRSGRNTGAGGKGAGGRDNSRFKKPRKKQLQLPRTDSRPTCLLQTPPPQRILCRHKRTELTRFKEKSKWNRPTDRDPALETFIMAVEKEILEHQKITAEPLKKNISELERKALVELKKMTNVIIKPADKGSAVVIIKREDYIQEALRQLNNKDHYRKVNHCLSEEHATKVRHTLLHLREDGTIDDTTYNYLSPPVCPMTPIFYLLPKIHKKGNPGRPILSANDCATERISEFADFHLRPLHTTDFLRRLNKLGKVPQNAILVILDVSSLYTNIPTDEGIQACREALQNDPADVPTEAICQLLDRILHLNNLEFNEEHYIQVQGTALGTRVAPSYANIFMGHFEDRFVYKRTVRPWIWWRYIDDIFAVWTRSEEELKSFIQDLNQAHRTIKFTVETSKTTINFLDVTASPMDSSCAYDASAQAQADTEKRPLSSGITSRKGVTKRPYWTPPSLVHRSAPGKTHYRKRHPQAPQDRTVLVTTYSSPHLPPLHTIIKKYWNLVQLSSRTRDIFQDPPLVAYRRNKNIKDMLVRARISKENRNFFLKFVPSGSFPCEKNRCTNCAFVKKANNFKSHRTGKCYAIRTHINCQSKNIVYLIQCKKCGVQYVGETKQTLANRLNGHRSAINTCTKKDTPVSAHFNQTHHSMGDLEILGIEKLCYTGNEDLTRQRRLQRESYWIHQLRTLHPDGLNQESLEITRV
ncbi:hypothetical protein Bbelb_266120 [Branchiostoma belcheri]|nr:hypothetical protein Bbelb_266120 [Branchiostoma belcheri]